MDVHKLPERRLYWKTDDIGIFKAPNYGKIMSQNRFDGILSNLQFFSVEDADNLILNFIGAVIECVQNDVDAGKVLVLHE